MKDDRTAQLEYEYYQFRLHTRRGVGYKSEYLSSRSPTHSPSGWQADAMDAICDRRSLVNKAFSKIQSAGLKAGALKHG